MIYLRDTNSTEKRTVKKSRRPFRLYAWLFVSMFSLAVMSIMISCAFVFVLIAIGTESVLNSSLLLPSERTATWFLIAALAALGFLVLTAIVFSKSNSKKSGLAYIVLIAAIIAAMLFVSFLLVYMIESIFYLLSSGLGINFIIITIVSILLFTLNASIASEGFGNGDTQVIQNTTMFGLTISSICLSIVFFSYQSIVL